MERIGKDIALWRGWVTALMLLLLLLVVVLPRCGLRLPVLVVARIFQEGSLSRVGYT